MSQRTIGVVGGIGSSRSPVSSPAAFRRPALDREGYRRADVTWEGVHDLVTWPGFWRLARRHWRTAAHELRGSLSVRAYMERASRYVPEMTASSISRTGSPPCATLPPRLPAPAWRSQS